MVRKPPFRIGAGSIVFTSTLPPPKPIRYTFYELTLSHPPQIVDSAGFQAAVAGAGDQLIVIDFFATWCVQAQYHRWAVV